MPTRTIQRLMGELPEPIFGVPADIWDSFDLTGEKGEFIIGTVEKALTEKGEIVVDINEKVKCPTYVYETITGAIANAMIIPRNIARTYGVKMDHRLQVVLEKIEKAGEEIDIYPKRMVEDFFPVTWEPKRR